MRVFPAYMYVHHLNAWCLRRSEKGICSPGTRVISDGEPLCGFWEWNPGPLARVVSP